MLEHARSNWANDARPPSVPGGRSRQLLQRAREYPSRPRARRCGSAIDLEIGPRAQRLSMTETGALGLLGQPGTNCEVTSSGSSARLLRREAPKLTRLEMDAGAFARAAQPSSFERGFSGRASCRARSQSHRRGVRAVRGPSSSVVSYGPVEVVDDQHDRPLARTASARTRATPSKSRERASRSSGGSLAGLRQVLAQPGTKQRELAVRSSDEVVGSVRILAVVDVVVVAVMKGWYGESDSASIRP